MLDMNLSSAVSCEWILLCLIEDVLCAMNSDMV